RRSGSAEFTAFESAASIDAAWNYGNAEPRLAPSWDGPSRVRSVRDDAADLFLPLARGDRRDVLVFVPLDRHERAHEGMLQHLVDRRGRHDLQVLLDVVRDVREVLLVVLRDQDLADAAAERRQELL